MPREKRQNFKSFIEGNLEKGIDLFDMKSFRHPDGTVTVTIAAKSDSENSIVFETYPKLPNYLKLSKHNKTYKVEKVEYEKLP